MSSHYLSNVESVEKHLRQLLSFYEIDIYLIYCRLFNYINHIRPNGMCRFYQLLQPNYLLLS